MYPEAGSSRSAPSYSGVGYEKASEGSGRASSARWDGERDWERGRERDDRDRANAYSRPGEPSTRPYNPSQQPRVPPPRSAQRPVPSSGPLARHFTPSPPRRKYNTDREREYERERNGPSGYDVRDRLSLDVGHRASSIPDGPSRASYPFPPRNGPRERDREWDREAWEKERDRDRERDRVSRWNERRDERTGGDTRHIPPLRPSPTHPQQQRFASDRPPPRSPPTAPRGPRSFAERTPPLSNHPRIPSGPASVTGSTPRDDSRRPIQGNDGILSAPKGPRKWRGSSSPADSKRFRPKEEISPATISEPTVAPALQLKTDVDGDLEEGEVVSPTLGVPQRSWPGRGEMSHHSSQGGLREDSTTRLEDQPRFVDRWRDERREPIPVGPRYNDRAWEDERSRFSHHQQDRVGYDDRPRQDERVRHPPDPHFVGREHQNSRRSEFDRSPPQHDEPRFLDRSLPDERSRPTPAFPYSQRSRSQDGQREFSSAPSRLQETRRLPLSQSYDDERPLVSSRRSSPVKVRRGSRGRGGSSSPVKRALPRPRRPSDATPWAPRERDDGWGGRGRSVSTQSDRRRISDGDGMDRVTDRVIGNTSSIHPLPEEDEGSPASAHSNEMKMEEDVKPRLDQTLDDVDSVDEDMTDEEFHRPATPAFPPEGMEDKKISGLAVDPPYRPDTPAYPPEGDEAMPKDEADPARDSEHGVSRHLEGNHGQAVTTAPDPTSLSMPGHEATGVHSPRFEVAVSSFDIERYATSPSPTGQSPPSDSAVTPAMLTRQSSPDVAIVQNSDPMAPPIEDLVAKSENILRVIEDMAMSVDSDLKFISDASIRKVTIAERRAIVLPPTNGPLSSPFGEKFLRKDPNPTGDSMLEGSTDTEMEAVPDPAKPSIPIGSPEGVLEDVRRVNIVKAVKFASEAPVVVDVEGITAWNVAAGPSRDTRAPTHSSPDSVERQLREITLPLSQAQARVTKLVAQVIRREMTEEEERVARLRAEYKEWDVEWRKHIEFLDRSMEKRGPPPAALYATPNTQPLTILAPHLDKTPGATLLAPTTPIDESFTSRAARRRGVGDAVTTEAEFQEILQGFADTADKDPNLRASKTTAIIPDMLPPLERTLIYNDENDLVDDPLAFYDFAGIGESTWTEADRSLFQKRYLAWPKDFGKIATGIPGKTASDCVSFYYRTKKEENYKDLLASRRGDKKRKGPAIKKSGKSSALLADLNRQKPTMLPPSTVSNALGERNIATPAKPVEGDGGVPGSLEPTAKRLKGMTPLAGDRRRKVMVNGLAGDDDDGAGSSAGPSRAGSETPPINRLKMRMNLKVGVNSTKRPRISSLSENIDGIPSPIEESPTNPLTETPGPASPVQIDLLPPVKRTAKRPKRAESISDPNAAISTPSTVIDDPMNGTTLLNNGTIKPSRRTATNSYWSVAEKEKFRELVAVHGTNVRYIAGLMGGKTERQIANFYEAHRDDMGLDDLARNAPSREVGMEDERVNGYPHQPFIGRSIYDAPQLGSHRASEAFGQHFGEPRLGTFPPNQYPHHTPSHPPGEPSPIKNFVSRPGGMNISALLNDDGPSREEPRPSNMDAASDGTVSERDAEGGVTRPSPRSIAPIAKPAFPPMRERHPSFGSYDRPEMDRYRASSAPKQYPYDPTLQPAWPRRADPSPTGYYPPRAATAAPVLPPQHRPSWDASSHLPAIQQHPHPPPLSHSHSQPSSRTHPPLGMFNPPQPHRMPLAAYDNRPKGPGHEWHYPTQTYAAAAGSRSVSGEGGGGPYTNSSLPPMAKTSPQPPQLPNIDPALQ